MVVKKCTKCGEIKEINKFYKSSYRKDGLQSACKICADSASKQSNSKNRLKYNATRKLVRDRTIQKYNEWKRSYGCCFCGEDEPICLELHHKDKTTKEFSPSNLRTYSWNTLMKEAKKCIIVCSNCHKKFTQELLVIVTSH